MRPDHRGGIVFRKVFSSTPQAIADSAIRDAGELLKDVQWRNRFRATLARARDFIKGVQGALQPLARGRACEFHFHAIALGRLENG